MVETRQRHTAAQAAPNIPPSGALSALRHRNFRLYFTAQIVSNVGTWVQITVENWLVLELSHSGLALGVTNALQFGPSLLLGMYGGVVADRHHRRRLLIITQAGLGLLALAVGLLAGIGVVRVWIIWLAAGAVGLVKSFDLPASQGFVKDLVGPADLPNAVAWTNTISATGRMVGPMVGGVVLAALGVAPRCGDTDRLGCGAFIDPSARSHLRLRRERRPVQRHGDQHVAVADHGRHARPSDGVVFHLLPGKQPGGRTSLRRARRVDRRLGRPSCRSVHLRRRRIGHHDRLAGDAAIRT